MNPSSVSESGNGVNVLINPNSVYYEPKVVEMVAEESVEARKGIIIMFASESH